MVYPIPSLFAPTLPSGVLIKPYLNEEGTNKAQVLLERHAVSLVTAGTKHVDYAEGRATVVPGRLLLMKQGQCLMTEKTGEAGHYGSLLVFFGNDLLHEVLQEAGQLADAAATDTFRVVEQGPLVGAWLQGVQAFGQAVPEALQRVKAKELLLLLLTEQGPEALSFLGSAVAGASDLRFRQAVENHVLANLGVEEMAFLCHMSRSTFKRTFERVYGEPPGRWLVRQRLQHAAVRLRQEAVRPSDVYFDYGFATLSGFIQAFKAEYGVTPKQYQLNQ